ncbi:hypothetical protein BW716_31790 [[Flexibacter] sp. ATCC 35208]|nr:hypothetical protein BW716_31790 [[Flexibacter] sp. ATCC 35208]
MQTDTPLPTFVEEQVLELVHALFTPSVQEVELVHDTLLDAARLAPPLIAPKPPEILPSVAAFN